MRRKKRLAGAEQLVLFNEDINNKAVDVLQECVKKIDELTAEVRRLAQAQEQKIVYLPRPRKPRATDQSAVEYLAGIFEREPRRSVASAIKELREKANEYGWRLGSDASLYRLVKKIC
ncbi:MAG: hypothetical protein AB1523_00115 [Bacillota bacterium]